MFPKISLIIHLGGRSRSTGLSISLAIVCIRSNDLREELCLFSTDNLKVSEDNIFLLDKSIAAIAISEGLEFVTDSMGITSRHT